MKSQLCLHVLPTMIKNTHTHTNHSNVKKYKVLGGNLMKYVQDLDSEKYKLLLTEIKRLKYLERDTMFMDWKSQYYDVCSPQIGL